MDFWDGVFGDEYTDRNKGDKLYASNIAYFAQSLRNASGIKTIMELGANRGMNIMALNALYPFATTSAVEMNEKAFEELQEVCTGEAINADLTEYQCGTTYDLVFTKGLLIHIPPQHLEKIYKLLYTTSEQYILIGEYYNPVPLMIPYRGEDNRLWKRDFAGEMIDRYPLKLIDYGFVYKRGSFPQDDITWFLLEKEF